MDKLFSNVKNIETNLQELQSGVESKVKELSIREKKFEEEKKIMAERYKIEETVIELNVGGKYFTTYKTTLCKYEHTFLEALFSGRHKAQKDSTGRYFIDRDGDSFVHILNFLRTGELLDPDSPYLKNQLKIELEYYGLNEVLNEMLPSFTGTTLLKDDHKKLLTNWHGNKKKKWKLIYKGSRDGFRASSFHQKCNNMGETISVIQSTQGYLFGGYCSISWSSRNNYVADPKAWLFSLINPSSQPTKLNQLGAANSYPNVEILVSEDDDYFEEEHFDLPSDIQQVRKSLNSIYDHAKNGPSFGCGATFGGGATFGSGHDLSISDRCNQNSNSYTYLGNTYNGKAYFLTGSNNFQVSEIEVFASA